MAVIAVHGGAGKATSRLLAARRAGVRQAVLAGWQVLKEGGPAVEAVERAVRVLEDDPAFNAGRGACLNQEGEIELDASIMRGCDLAAGAVGAVKRIANPVTLARAVMEAGRHVLLVGPGAQRFAAEVGIEACPPEALVTDRQRARWAASRQPRHDARGTVGAVARDRHGHLAAATSTGGIPLKAAGRVGDSALIGCGTYADDRLGAASCTGTGEAIIKLVLARIALELLRTHDDPVAAATHAVDLVTTRTGGEAGIILIDPLGRIGYARNTPQMSWGTMGPDEPAPRVLD